MSITTPDSPAAGTGQQIVLPAGVSIGPGRETSQTNGQGQLDQGMVFPVTLPNGTNTTVFVPYSLMRQLPQVQALFDERIGAITAITG